MAGKRRPEDRRIMPNLPKPSDDPPAPRHKAQTSETDGEEGEGRGFVNLDGRVVTPTLDEIVCTNELDIIQSGGQRSQVRLENGGPKTAVLCRTAETCQTTRLRRVIKPRPARPMAKRARVAGS